MSLSDFFRSRQTQLTDPLDKKMEALQLLGYTTLERVFSHEDVRLMAEKLDAIYAEQQKELPDHIQLADIDDLYNVRMPMFYDDHFVGLCKTEAILDIAKKLIGPYFILYGQNCNITAPNEDFSQSYWHRDIPYQDIPSRDHPLAMTSIACLDDFTAENGGTWVLPYSHQMPNLPSAAYLEKHALPLEAQKGDVLIFNGHLFHKAGENATATYRRGLVQVYCIGNFRQQYDTAAFFRGKYQEDPVLRMLLAYDLPQAGSVSEWRENRFQKFNLE